LDFSLFFEHSQQRQQPLLFSFELEHSFSPHMFSFLTEMHKQYHGDIHGK